MENMFLSSLVLSLTTLLEMNCRKLVARLPLVRAAQQHFTTYLWRCQPNQPESVLPHHNCRT